MGIYSPVALAAVVVATVIDKLTFGALSRMADQPRVSPPQSEPTATSQSKAPGWISGASAMRGSAAETQPESDAPAAKEEAAHSDEAVIDSAPGPR
jgi:hypothetical protein